MASASALFSGVPAGVCVPYAGASAPEGWLLAYGQTVSRTTYAALFAEISTTYGSGDGSTTFNLPDYRGRAPFGKDDMGGSAAGRLNNTGINGTTQNPVGTTLGATGGSDRVQWGRRGGFVPIGTGSLTDSPDEFDGAPSSAGAGESTNYLLSRLPPAIVQNWIIKT